MSHRFLNSVQNGNWPEGHHATPFKSTCKLFLPTKETWEPLMTRDLKWWLQVVGWFLEAVSLTYLKQLIGKPTTQIVLVGFQAEGPEGVNYWRAPMRWNFWKVLYGQSASASFGSLSAHGDQGDFSLAVWYQEYPRACFSWCMVGRPWMPYDPKLEQTHGWNVHIPTLFKLSMFLCL